MTRHGVPLRVQTIRVISIMLRLSQKSAARPRFARARECTRTTTGNIRRWQAMLERTRQALICRASGMLYRMHSNQLAMKLRTRLRGQGSQGMGMGKAVDRRRPRNRQRQ